MDRTEDQPRQDEAQSDLLQQFQAEQWQSWAEAERARRQRALRDLVQQAAAREGGSSAPQAHHAAARSPAISLAPPRRLAGPPWLLILAGVLAVAVMAGVGAAVLHQGASAGQRQASRPAPTVPADLTITPNADGLGCVQDAAWSPDGSRIAVLGYQPDATHICPASDPVDYAYEPGIVAIYSAATGALLTRLSPDRTIIPALHLKPPRLPALPSTMTNDRGNTSQQLITYTSVLWSADGSRLALLFAIDHHYNLQINPDGSTSSQSVSTFGVLATALAVSRSEVLLGPAPNTADNSSTPVWEWDLAQASYIPGPSPADPMSEQTALPQALGYSWNADGTLNPLQLLMNGVVPQAPAPGLVGNPAGSPQFTIWQPGYIAPDSQWGSGVYDYQSQFSAWSPDGRYLYPYLPGYGLAKLLMLPVKNGLSPQDVATALPPTELLLPLRDKALSTVMSHGNFGYVAWSLNGRQLAMVRQFGTPARTTGVDVDHVQVYDCATGAEVATLVQSLGQNVSARLTIRWSPDSTRVFLVSYGIDSIGVWTVPKAVR
ncbi:MAG TPA: hypothetical protein VGS80_20275 [Ktedonobacterales bacterium]|nr:hypothetical protein [Ktedonobacterales bacterium]